MAEEQRSIRSIFASAEAKRKQLDLVADRNNSSYQEAVNSALAEYEECQRLVEQASLFSPNETVDDISSGDLQYLLVLFYCAELMLKTNTLDRKTVLRRARDYYERYLNLVDTYGLLSDEDKKLYERYLEARNTFSTASTTDAAARRATKIARFRAEKELKQKLELLQQDPGLAQNDETTVRDLHLTNIAFSNQQTFQSLESIAQELDILSLAPPAPAPGQTPLDDRRREETRDGYSDRLDRPISELLAGGKAGPILSKDGKPLRPFTLLDSRQRLQEGVFRPGHNLPTMTIDEYLEEEKRRGGIIEGGGAQSGLRPEPDEDDLDKADEETMKARAWDEYVEANPKGSGNTLNRG